MARLNIERYEQRVLYPEASVKHYRIFCSLQTSDGKSHATYCDVSKESNSPLFDFGCFDNADIDEFDYRNNWAMSEKVLNWAKANINESVSTVEQDKKSG